MRETREMSDARCQSFSEGIQAGRDYELARIVKLLTMRSRQTVPALSDRGIRGLIDEIKSTYKPLGTPSK